MGDPSGCGPEITLRAINDCREKGVDFFVVGDIKIAQAVPVYKRARKKFTFIDVATPGIGKMKQGRASCEGGRAGLSYLCRALDIMRAKGIRRLVTAPLSKEAVQLVSKGFKGHTEYMADYFKVKKFAMVMVSKKIKVALLSRHILLSDAAKSIRPKIIRDTY